MKTFVSKIIPKLKDYGKKLDNTSVLTQTHWILVEDNLDRVIKFIFREKNNQLLISTNGKIEKANWDYIDKNTILIEREHGDYLFKHGFLNEEILALNVDGTEEYALFVCDKIHLEGINSNTKIDRYLDNLVNDIEEELSYRNKKIEEQVIKEPVKLDIKQIGIPEKKKTSEEKLKEHEEVMRKFLKR